MVLTSDDSCSLESSKKIFEELTLNDKHEMHTMEEIPGVDHLYFTWVTSEEFVDGLAAVIEKQATSLALGAAFILSMADCLI